MENRLMVREGQLLAVFNSAHRVMQAEGLLKSLGFQVLLIPAPRELMTDCGLAIRFNPEEHSSVMQALAGDSLLPEYVSRLDQGAYLTVWRNDQQNELEKE